MNKIKAQICFSGKADLTKVKEQLIQLKEQNEFEFWCAFLPKHIVIEKGWDTSVVDLLEEVIGNEMHWIMGEYETFNDAIKDLPEKRKQIANLVNRMFVLDSGNALGVAEEIKLFTNCKVILM